MKRKYLIASLFSILFSWNLMAQVDMQNKEGYQFTVEKTLDCTDVKSQGNTGTCWSFATSSFLESELIRNGNGTHDLSEMHVVKNIYKDKARNYVLRQGKANFSQGSLSHDVINAAMRNGLVPEEVFSGLDEGKTRHDHGEVATLLKGMLDGVLKRKRLSPKWKQAFEAVLDVYFGESPEQFTYKGKSYTPQTYAESMGFNADNYVSFTSYTHHPFYKSFVLEIPDNYSNGSFYNLPVEELMKIIDHAVDKGYSVAWDGDVSEKGFSAKEGIAVLAKDPKREDLFQKPGEELAVSQEMRQETFESYQTTDDHLMHLTGVAKDQNGQKYFLIKNSWGEISPYKGFLYMSENYAKLKTVAIMVHKDAVPKTIWEKIKR